MKVLVDTNVVLDLLLDREPFSDSAARLFSLIEEGRVTGYLCATTLTTIHYLAGKVLGRSKARDEVRKCLSFLEVAAVTRPVLENALNSNLQDFEDAVLCEAAREIGAEAIVTRNKVDFKKAPLPTHTPQEFLLLLDPHFS
ncbi:MAG: PIN domain-containing protein [Elusimicrobia bacterium]|nr:PIN domain-containing protein [Elusimicrobiota bacterium]